VGLFAYFPFWKTFFLQNRLTLILAIFCLAGLGEAVAWLTDTRVFFFADRYTSILLYVYPDRR
jgi:hypothetical protein